MEILTCPKCLEQVTTAKALRFGDDKTIRCSKCDFICRLGVARGREPLFQEPKAIIVYDSPKPIQVDDPPQIAPIVPQQQIFHHIYRQERDNTLAALASFFIPGLGQLVQGRVVAAIVFFVMVPMFYLTTIVLGIVLHIACVVDAVRFDGNRGIHW